jgi:hypothetical protein
VTGAKIKTGAIEGRRPVDFLEPSFTMRGSDNTHSADMTIVTFASEDPESLKEFIAHSIHSLGIEGVRSEIEPGCKKARLQFANNLDAQFAQIVIPEDITVVEQIK